MITNFRKAFCIKSFNPFSIFAIAILSLSFSNADAKDDPPLPTISVNGTAEVRAAPDEAVLTFSVESRETDLDAAVKDNDERIKAVTSFLKESKIEAKHIRTELITIRPIFDTIPNGWKGQMAQLPAQQAFGNAPLARPAPAPDKKKKIKPIGYTARRSLSITIKDLAAFETIYRGLIGKGVNDVGGIQFRTTELRKHRDEARLKAVKAAREKAEAMAAELGATLSSVQTITESSTPRHSNFFQNSISPVSAFNESHSSIATGVIEIKASVHVVFRLADTELAHQKE